MKKGKILLAMVFAAFFITACGDYVEIPAPIPQLLPEIETGDWAQLAKYPYQKYGEMSSGKIKELGLERREVTKPLTVFNHQRQTDRWKLETLPTGTLVVSDATGRPWYKISCGNRLYIPVRQVLAPVSTSRRAETKVVPSEGLKTRSGRWGSLSGLWNFIRNLAEMIGGLAMLLLLILMALALLVAAWLIARWLRDRLHQPPAVVPPPPVVPPVGGGGAPPVIPGPAPNENGVGVFRDATGNTRIVSQGIDQQSILINNGRVTLDVTIRPVAP